MKKVLSVFLSIAIVVSVLSIGTITALADELEPTPKTFLDRFRTDATLAFSDEFEGDTLDESKWQIQKDWSRVDEVWGTVDDGNISVSDGNLKLRAYEKLYRNVANGKETIKPIQSAEIQSRAAWKDGLIEIRAKLPKGQGVYPAIWTMGRDYSQNTCNWPWSGEIDIMEAVGDDNTDRGNCSTWQTLHTGRPNSESKQHGVAHIATGSGKYTTLNNKPLNDDFHTFWVYLTDEYMIIGVDDNMQDILYFSDPNLACFKYWEQWLILGLQMGGLAGDLVRTDYSVWEMLIDYVRVYRLEDRNDYKNYRAIEAEEFNTDCSVSTTTSLCTGETVKAVGSETLNSVITGLEPGTYDVYAAARTFNSESTYTPYIAGTEISDVSISSYEEIPDGDTPYLGTVKVTDNSPFEIELKNTKAASNNTTNYEIDKYFFVKSTNEPHVTVNSENCYTDKDLIEVGTADEFYQAFNDVAYNGTIKLTSDITLTKSLNITKDVTVDLNGNTIDSGTLKQGINIYSQGSTCTFKNGKIVAKGNSNIMEYMFIMQKATTLNLENLDIDITAYKFTKDGYALIGSPYSSGGKTLNITDCDVALTCDTSLNANQYMLKGIFGATKINFTNSTFDGNGDMSLFYCPGVNSNDCYFFRNCEIMNFATICTATSDFKSTVYPIKFANTTIKDCTNLASSDANAAKFLPTTNNTRYTLTDVEIAKEDVTNTIGSIKFVCTHEYNAATCTKKATCKYCKSTTGAEPANHIAGEPVVTRQASCYYSEITTVSCTECGEVISETETAPIKGHDFEESIAGEDTCTTMRYRLKECKNCDCYVTENLNTHISGAFTYGYHTPDTSKPIEHFSGCTSHDGYSYTCLNCGAEKKQILSLGDHKITMTAFTPATEDESGSITYGCETCEYANTITYEYGTKLVTLDGVKYVAKGGYYFTPYNTPANFLYYEDAQGNKYSADEGIAVTEDLSLTTILNNDAPATTTIVVTQGSTVATQSTTAQTSTVTPTSSSTTATTTAVTPTASVTVAPTEATSVTTTATTTTPTTSAVVTSTTVAPTVVTQGPTTATPTTSAVVTSTTVAPTVVTQGPTTATPTTTTKAVTTIESTTAPVSSTTKPSTALYGDANEDGKINMADVLILRKYLAKWNVTLNLTNADCTADGKVNMADVLILRKYLAKWNVTLGPTV